MNMRRSCYPIASLHRMPILMLLLCFTPVMTTTVLSSTLLVVGGNMSATTSAYVSGNPFTGTVGASDGGTDSTFSLATGGNVQSNAQVSVPQGGAWSLANMSLEPIANGWRVLGSSSTGWGAATEASGSNFYSLNVDFLLNEAATVDFQIDLLQGRGAFASYNLSYSPDKSSSLRSLVDWFGAPSGSDNLPYNPSPGPFELEAGILTLTITQSGGYSSMNMSLLTVPEPSCIVLLGVAWIWCFQARRRTGSH